MLGKRAQETVVNECAIDGNVHRARSQGKITEIFTSIERSFKVTIRKWQLYLNLLTPKHLDVDVSAPEDRNLFCTAFSSLSLSFCLSVYTLLWCQTRAYLVQTLTNFWMLNFEPLEHEHYMANAVCWFSFYGSPCTIIAHKLNQCSLMD